MTIKPSGQGKIKILHSGRHWKVGQVNATLKTVVLAAGAFHVHQKGKTFLKSQIGILWVGELFLERLAKSWQAESVELVKQGLDEHSNTP
jgi:hypothetical protein